MNESNSVLFLDDKNMILWEELVCNTGQRLRLLPSHFQIQK